MASVVVNRTSELAAYFFPRCCIFPTKDRKQFHDDEVISDSIAEFSQWEHVHRARITMNSLYYEAEINNH